MHTYAAYGIESWPQHHAICARVGLQNCYDKEIKSTLSVMAQMFPSTAMVTPTVWKPLRVATVPRAVGYGEGGEPGAG